VGVVLKGLCSVRQRVHWDNYDGEGNFRWHQRLYDFSEWTSDFTGTSNMTIDHQYIGLKDLYLELQKLNKAVDQLLCFQKLASIRYAKSHPAMGPSTSKAIVEGEGSLCGLPTEPDASEPDSG